METTSQDKIRQAVRKAYGKIAKVKSASSEDSLKSSCCGPSDISEKTNLPISCCGPSNISKEKSASAQCGCGDSDFTLEQVSSALGYSLKDLESIPEGANMGLGCGNPVALASLKPGETVVIGDDVRITVLAVRGSQIKLGIDAPREVRVNREEVLDREWQDGEVPAPPPAAQRESSQHGSRQSTEERWTWRRGPASRDTGDRATPRRRSGSRAGGRSRGDGHRPAWPRPATSGPPQRPRRGRGDPERGSEAA